MGALNGIAVACQYGAMSTHRMRALVLAAVAAALLAACETPPPAPVFPELTYGHLGQLRLDVAAVEVVSEYLPPLADPNVEHRVPRPPEAALHRWAADRLRAAGAKGTARFVIGDASIIETKLKIDTGFTGAFKKEQSERYQARVSVTLELLDDKGLRRGFAAASASRSMTLDEDASLNDRDRLWFDLVKALMADFDAVMEENIRRHLGGFLF